MESLQKRLLAAVFACLLVHAGPVAAQSTPAASASAKAPASAEDAVARVQTGRVEAYERVLAEYDAAVAAAPSDPAIAVERCRFVSRFTDEDYDWVERAPADLDACLERIDARWPKDPRVRLFRLDQAYGEDAIELGKPWLEDAGSWPVEQRRELYAKLSTAYGDDDKIRSGDLAVQAAELGDAGSVAAAVERLADAGEAKRAQALLQDAGLAATTWAASQRVEAALKLPDQAAALREMRRYDGADFKIDATTAARACLRGGDIACAREALKRNAKVAGNDELKQVRFDVALAASDMPAAVEAIDIAGGKGFVLAIERFAMVLNQSPGTLFTGKLMLIAIVFLFVVLIMALFPALLLVPVHYRGLARRVAGKPAVPVFERIGLPQAWWGSAVVTCLPMLVALVVAPRAMGALLGGDNAPPQDELMRLTLWGSLLGLLLLVPVARRFGVWRILGDRVAWRQNWWRVLVAWGVLIAISVAINLANRHVDTSTMQTKMIESLVDGGRSKFGTPWVLMLLSVLVPIYEELVFRGLLLGGMSRHISFGWANAIQATLFAFAHNDSPRFVFYLALGLLCGWLVKKSKSLGPGIALHSVNNTLATVVRMAMGGG